MSATFATPVEMSPENQKIIEYFQTFFNIMKKGDESSNNREEKTKRLLLPVVIPIMNLLQTRFDEKLGRGHPLSETDWEPLRSRICDKLFSDSLIHGTSSLSNCIYNEYKQVIFHCVFEKTEKFTLTAPLRQTPKIPISVDEMRTYYFDATERTWIIEQLHSILSPLETEFRIIVEQYNHGNQVMEEECNKFMSHTSDEEFKANIETLMSIPEIKEHFPERILTSIREMF